MMLRDQLEEQWWNSERFRRFEPNISLESRGLVLGNGTVLAVGERDRLGRNRLKIDGAETRLLTLLSVAHGRLVSRQSLRHIRNASERWREGEPCQAAIHLAFLQLPRLDDRRDAARRLFIADGMIAAGIDPAEILKAFGLESGDFGKFYDEDETRIPAGNGLESGRWARMGVAFRSLFADLSGAEALELSGFAARFAVPTLAVGAMFFPKRAGGSSLEGDIPGAPDLRYSWNSDETRVRITGATGKTLSTAELGPDGTFRDEQQRVVGREVEGQVVLDAAAVRAELPKGDEAGEDPKLCPVPGKDKAGRTSAAGEKDKDYEDYVKSLVNPLNPTPRGFGVQLPNPLKGGFPVFYDDCQRQSGILIDAKGTGYAEPLQRSRFMTWVFEYSWTAQAQRQIAASGGRPIQWHFAEQGAADHARELFRREGLTPNSSHLYALDGKLICQSRPF